MYGRWFIFFFFFLLFAGFVARVKEEHLPQRVMFGELVEGKGYSGGQEKDWLAHLKDMSGFGMKFEGWRKAAQKAGRWFDRPLFLMVLLCSYHNPLRVVLKRKQNPPLFLIVWCACGSALSVHTYLAHKEAHAHTYTQKHRLWLSQRRELTARLMLHSDCHKYRALRVMWDAVAQ